MHVKLKKRNIETGKEASQRFFSPYFEITINTKCQIVLRHIVSKYQCADEEMNSMKI